MTSDAPARPQTLTPDELLTTTRAVRRRLDFGRPVERRLVEECLAIAQQAPTGGNMQPWSFVVVGDAARKRALAELYRRGLELYRPMPIALPNVSFGDPARDATQARVWRSVEYLAEHLEEAPYLLIPCVSPRPEGPTIYHASFWGSVMQAAWSFMLAARARGLGTCWTTLHLFFEEEAAEVLGIPYADVAQAALIPVAHTRGDTFKPAPRAPLESVVHWDRW